MATTPAPKYEEYVPVHHPHFYRQILEESNPHVVQKIDAIVQEYNKEVKKGPLTWERFLEFYEGMFVLVKE